MRNVDLGLNELRLDEDMAVFQLQQKMKCFAQGQHHCQVINTHSTQRGAAILSTSCLTSLNKDLFQFTHQTKLFD